MAYGKNDMAGGGGDDLYASDADKPMPAGKEDGGDEEHSDSVEAILPKAILAGKHFDVGDEVVLQVTAIHDQEISVKYAPSKDEEGEGGEEPAEDMKSEMPESGGSMGGGDSMYD